MQTATNSTSDTDPSAAPDRRRRRAATVAAAALVLGTGAVGILSQLNRGDLTDHEGGWIGPRVGEATVIYEFHDASVAPEYHRSYTLTIWDSSARIVVDSYGDVLEDRTINIDVATWERTLAAANEFHGVDSVTNPSCSGATSDELTVLDGDKNEVVHVFVDDCDTGERPYLGGAVCEVRDLFDLDELLATVANDNDNDNDTVTTA